MFISANENGGKRESKEKREKRGKKHSRRGTERIFFLKKWFLKQNKFLNSFVKEFKKKEEKIVCKKSIRGK